MRRIISIILMVVMAVPVLMAETSTRKERLSITTGNEAYKAKDYAAALKYYKAALKDNPSSLPAQFNKALAQLQLSIAMDPAKKQEKDKMLQEVREAFTAIAQHTSDNPSLASRANYNLGNISYAGEDYQAAVDFYKQALRLNPHDDRARKNLRLAQLKLKQQKKDDKKDNQQNNQDQQDNKDQKQQPKPQQDKDKDKDKNNKPDDQQPKPQQQQPQQQGMSQQAADRILKHSSDKEKETLKKAMYGRERPNSSSRRRW